jgi:hypothetical protein
MSSSHSRRDIRVPVAAFPELPCVGRPFSSLHPESIISPCQGATVQGPRKRIIVHAWNANAMKGQNPPATTLSVTYGASWVKQTEEARWPPAI